MSLLPRILFRPCRPRFFHAILAHNSPSTCSPLLRWPIYPCVSANQQWALWVQVLCRGHSRHSRADMKWIKRRPNDYPWHRILWGKWGSTCKFLGHPSYLLGISWKLVSFMNHYAPGASSKLQSRSVSGPRLLKTLHCHAQRHIRRARADEIIHCHSSSVEEICPTHQTATHI